MWHQPGEQTQLAQRDTRIASTPSDAPRSPAPDSGSVRCAAAIRAVEHSTRARQSPDIYVIDPQRLGPAKDPDEFVRQRGTAAWHDLLQNRECGITWHAKELASVTRDAPAPQRRAALARAAQWLGALPPRLALEQEDALRIVANQCGYGVESVQRAFQARYWRDPHASRERIRPAPEQGHTR